MIELNWSKPKAHWPGRLLALDTSTAVMSVAILEEGRLLKEVHILADRTHSLHLMPMIQELIQACGMKLSELSAIAVGVGPGSYTGVRIGVTAAKTLAWTLKLPIIGVSSLEAMALGAGVSETRAIAEAETKQQWIVPLMDARRAQAYTGLYAMTGDDQWSCLVSDGIRLMDNWLKQLEQTLIERTESHPLKVSFVGEQSTLMGQIEAFASLGNSNIQYKDAAISALYIGLLGSIRLAAGEQANVHQLIPNYTQLTEAENNLLAKAP